MTLTFVKFGMAAALAFAATSAMAQPGLSASHGAVLTAQNDMSTTRDSKIQKQTHPRKNGTDQSEGRNGMNKNGQMQK